MLSSNFCQIKTEIVRFSSGLQYFDNVRFDTKKLGPTHH